MVMPRVSLARFRRDIIIHVNNAMAAAKELPENRIARLVYQHRVFWDQHLKAGDRWGQIVPVKLCAAVMPPHEARAGLKEAVPFRGIGQSGFPSLLRYCY